LAVEVSAMNVSLTPELERYIAGKVESGLYNNASEVVREGLRHLKEEEDLRVRWRAQIEDGWQSALRGEFVDGPTSMAEGRRRLKALAKTKKRA